MPHWNDGTHWSGGARWAPAAPITNKKRTMAIIATNTTKLPIPDKLQRGQDIITKSTSNPNVPGNTAVLAAFTNAQEDLVAANNAHVGAQTTLKNLMDQRDDALAAWNNCLGCLAAFTESATQGDSTKITSTGFDVRGPRSPKPPLGAPTDVQAKTNGSPGVTKLSWNTMDGVRLFIVQQTNDEAAQTGWAQVATPTKASCDVGGADPGKPTWFRVAAVDASGQGPWSEPARRPVM